MVKIILNAFFRFISKDILKRANSSILIKDGIARATFASKKPGISGTKIKV